MRQTHDTRLLGAGLGKLSFPGGIDNRRYRTKNIAVQQQSKARLNYLARGIHLLGPAALGYGLDMTRSLREELSPYVALLTSTFAFGRRASGVVEGVLAACGVAASHITPAAWKRAVGLSLASKSASRAEAIRRWPDRAALFARVKDERRAEAVLIGVAMRKGGA